MFLFNTLIGSSAAFSKEFKIEQFNVSLAIPEGWQALRGYLGRDLSLLSREHSGKRDTVFLELTDDKRINLVAEKKAQENFRKIKMEWLKKKAGKLIRFNLNKKLDYLKRPYLYHEVSYELNGKSYIEGDLFLQCGPDVGANLSFLILTERQLVFSKNLKSILSSLKCHKN